MMSSMWRVAAIIPMLLVTVPSSSAQYVQPGAIPAAAYASPSIASALNTWRALRQSSGYRFSDYASFLIANPDWPDESKMRGWAEKAMGSGENAGTVLAFFATDKPRTGRGWAQLAIANAASGRSAEALDAARRAWRSGDLGSTDEQMVWGEFGNSLTRSDNEDRVEALLFAKRPDDATVIDGHGKTLLPGLIDAHGHVLELGYALTQADLTGTQSIDEALARIKDYAKAHPDARWIIGG